MKILITGANGFVGSYLAKKLSNVKAVGLLSEVPAEIGCAVD